MTKIKALEKSIEIWRIQAQSGKWKKAWMFDAYTCGCPLCEEYIFSKNCCECPWPYFDKKLGDVRCQHDPKSPYNHWHNCFDELRSHTPLVDRKTIQRAASRVLQLLKELRRKEALK